MSTYESLISIGQDYGVFVLDRYILLMCHCYWRALGWSYPCHVSQNCDVFYVKNPIKFAHATDVVVHVGGVILRL